MSNGRLLRLHLGLRFTTSLERQVANRAERFLAEIERLEEESPVPLYWNFPVAPILEKQSRRAAILIEAITKRVRSGQDRIIPCGFSAAPHPLLLPEELQRELLWCYRNPWFPALEKLLDAHPEVILPVHPDLYSEAVGKAYSRQGFTVIGIPVPLYRLCPPSGKNRWTELRALATSDYSIRGVNSEAKLRPIAVLRPKEATPEGIDTLLSACGRAEDLYLMLDLTGGVPSGDSEVPAAVQRLFRLVNRHRRIEFYPFSAKTRKPAPTPIDTAELMKFVEPVGRCLESGTWDRIETLRTKKRKSNLQIRDLLRNLAAVVPAGAIPSPDRAKNRKKETIEITSISMAGSVTLIGVGLQATFSQGRLSNLIDHGKKVLPGEPGQSVFTLSNKREFLRTDSAFSFDREGQTGLRSILSSRIGRQRKGVQIILDYYFADARSCLNLDIKACYPALPPGIVTEATPLELCFRSFSEDDRPIIEVQTPDREPYREIVAPAPGVVVLWGKSFRLKQGSWSVELLASALQNTRSEQVEFRVEKRQGKAYLLWVNLGGSYLPQPAANLSTRQLDLSYVIRFGGAAGRGKRS